VLALLRKFCYNNLLSIILIKYDARHNYCLVKSIKIEWTIFYELF